MFNCKLEYILSCVYESHKHRSTENDSEIQDVHPQSEKGVSFGQWQSFLGLIFTHSISNSDI